MTVNLKQHKYISIIYLIGGAIGAVMFLPQIAHLPGNILSIFATVLLFLQIIASLYGGWKFLKNEAIGIQILYWVSISCIPVISFPLLSYWAYFGAGLFPSLSVGSYSGFNFNFNFGYGSQLWIFPDESGLTFGINIVALVLMLTIKKIMHSNQIPFWPVKAKA